MPDFDLVGAMSAATSGSARGDMAAPPPLAPPESHKIAQLWILVELALCARLRREPCGAPFNIEDGLHIQREAELFQLVRHHGNRFPIDLHFAALYDLPGIDSRIDPLDGNAGGLLAVVHRPEGRLLAAILRHLAMVDSQSAEPGYLEEARPEDGAAIDQPQIRIQRPQPLQCRISMNIRKRLNPTLDSGPPASKRHLGLRIGHESPDDAKGLHQEQPQPQPASTPESILNYGSQCLSVGLAQAADELDLRLRFKPGDEVHHGAVQRRPTAEQHYSDRSAQIS